MLNVRPSTHLLSTMAFSPIGTFFNFPLVTFHKEGIADENQTLVVRLSGTVTVTVMYREAFSCF